jgi:hypothetical protein
MNLASILARLVVIAIVLWAATAFRRRRPRQITVDAGPFMRLTRTQRRRRKRLGLDISETANRRVR